MRDRLDTFYNQAILKLNYEKHQLFFDLLPLRRYRLGRQNRQPMSNGQADE